MITRPAYCSRTDLTRAADIEATPRAVADIDRALCSGADAVDTLLNRQFYPLTATKSFRWPQRGRTGPAWRLWLYRNEIITLSALVAGGVSIDVNTSVYLEPQEDGPPYDRIELVESLSSVFAAGPTPQRSIVVTGTWGYDLSTAVVGTLVGAVNASVTTVVVSNSVPAGPGELLIAGTEYMLITDAAMVTTSQTLQTPLTADTADTAVAVTTGSAYAPGETILLDSERMEIRDIAGNTLTVTRAVQGSVLATHTGSTIYAPRSYTVVRGAVGTTAASHLDGAALTKHLPPPLVTQLNLAYAQVAYSEGQGAYARPAGAGSRTQPQPGAGLPALEAEAYAGYGRVLDGVI